MFLLNNLEAGAFDGRLAWRRQLERLASREDKAAAAPGFRVQEHRKVRGAERAHEAIHAGRVVEMAVAEDDRLEVLCECGEDGCDATFDVTHAEYDQAHEQRDRFMVAPGHENEQIEHVVNRTPRYLIVDKFGDAERVVEAEERREDSP